MAELSLMASAVFSPAPFYQDQTTCRSFKEVSTTLPGYGNRRDILKSASVLVDSPPFEEKWLPMNLLPTFNQPQRSIPMVKKTVLDMQDARPDSVLFSFEITEQCARREKIMKFLFSGSNEEEGINTSLMSEVMGLQTVSIEACDMYCLYEVGVHDLDHILHSTMQFHIPKPLLEFIADGSNASNITVHPDGRMQLTGGESEIKDLFSVAAGFNMLKGFATSNKKPMVVPYFTRSRGGHARASSKGSVAPSKSMKLKPSSAKKKNAERSRDLYPKNYFRACENLLSAVMDKKKSSMVAFSLKKSGPEITQLLSQFAAGIAGTGLATILLSLTCKTATGRTPLSAAKVLNTVLGIAFLCLSWSINGLRETVSCISRRGSNKLKLTEEEIVGRVGGSVNQVLFVAAALLVITVLRFA